jgi:hypothetical protein
MDLWIRKGLTTPEPEPSARKPGERAEPAAGHEGTADVDDDTPDTMDLE